MIIPDKEVINERLAVCTDCDKQQDMSENPKLKWLLVANFAVATCCIFDYSDDLRETLELVPYPNDEFKTTVIRILFIDLAFCYALEKCCKIKYLKSFEDTD